MKSQLKSTKWALFISHWRWWERTPKVWWAARLNISQSRLNITIPEGDLENFFNLWALKAIFHSLCHFSPDFCAGPVSHSVYVRAGFRQNEFFADFYFRAAGFFRDFLAGFFLLIFVGKVPRKILQENPRESPPKFIQQKSSNTFLQIAQGNIWPLPLQVYKLLQHKLFCVI